MDRWQVWCQIKPGAFEYLGCAAGRSFAEACAAMAKANPQFRADFEPEKMTFNGNPLLPLDRRIDGVSIQFGRMGEG